MPTGFPLAPKGSPFEYGNYTPIFDYEQDITFLEHVYSRWVRAINI
jgi:hypothetical protein